MMDNEIFDEMCRTGTAEAVDFHAILEQDDSGESPDTVFSGQFHVVTFIDFEFGQHNLAGKGFNDTCQQRSDGDAWTTPVSPEINQHGALK